MKRRIVVNVPLYNNALESNLIFISPEADSLSKTNQIQVTNKYESYEFQSKVGPFVPSGAITASYQVQKVYGLKLYHSYKVRSLSPVEPPKGLSDILKTKFEFQSKVGGLDHIFKRIFGDVLLSSIYPESFVSKTCVPKPKGIILYGPPGTRKTLITRTLCDLLNIQPKIVSGPKILNHMLGESEHKMRDLFADAR